MESDASEIDLTAGWPSPLFSLEALNTTFRAVHFRIEIQESRLVRFSMVETPCVVQISGSQTIGI